MKADAQRDQLLVENLRRLRGYMKHIAEDAAAAERTIEETINALTPETDEPEVSVPPFTLAGADAARLGDAFSASAVAAILADAPSDNDVKAVEEEAAAAMGNAPTAEATGGLQPA